MNPYFAIVLNISKMIKLILSFFCLLLTAKGYNQTDNQFVFHHQLDDVILSNEEEVHLFEKWLPSTDSFEITGYSIVSFCDSTASATYNEQLSKARLDFIKASISINAPIQEEYAYGEDYTAYEYKASGLADYRITVVTVFYQPIAKDYLLQEHQEVIQDTKEVIIENHYTNVQQVDFESLEVGECIVFPGLLFEGGRAVLLPQSMPILDSIAAELNHRESIHFTIEGRICCHPNDGTDGENFDSGTQTLSLDRAKAVFIELKKRGVDKNRMDYVGLMASKPLGYEQYRDRRVEFKITQL